MDLGEFPTGIKYVGEYAFENVESPCEINGITMDSVPAYAFYKFKGLSKIRFASPLKYLGYGSFGGTSISTFHLPASLMNAEEISYPFEGGTAYNPVVCENLKNVTFEEGTYKFNVSLHGTSIENLEVPDGVREFRTRIPLSLQTLSLPVECIDLDKYMLGYNRSVQISWRIPAGYVYEGDDSEHIIPEMWYTNMFTSNIQMTIPEGVTKCDKNAFQDSSLAKLTFPSTLTWISRWALDRASISAVEFMSEIPPKSDNYDSLTGYRVSTFYVPMGSKEAYSTSLLKGHKNIIEQPRTIELVLDADSINLDEESVYLMGVKVSPDCAEIEGISWYSSDEQVATVRGSGSIVKIIRVGNGHCEITANTKFHNEIYSATVYVSVNENTDLAEIKYDRNQNIRIYNLIGRLVYEGKYEDIKLEPGLYIISDGKKSSKISI